MHVHNGIVREVAGTVNEYRERQPLWHPLGFVGCFLSPARDTSVRIHYWPKGERRPKQPHWPIHTHAFGLTSTVLLGAVTDRRYATREGANFAPYGIDYIDDEGRESRLAEGNGLLEATCVEEQTYQAGASYHVPMNTFHTSDVRLDDEAVTIVTVSKVQSSGCIVLGAPRTETVGYERSPFDRDLFWRKVANAFSVWSELSTD